MKLLIVSFSGNDGTGKSTLARELCLWLSEKGINTEYHRFFEYFLLKYLFRLIPSKVVNKSRIKLKGINTYPNFFYRLWSFIVLFESLIAIFYYKNFKKNKIIVFDRFFYDYLVSFELLGYKNKMLDFLANLIPSPDFLFILDVDVDIAKERKKDDESFNAKNFSLLREKYLNKARELNTAPINTSAPKDLVFNQIWSKIEEKVNKKFY